MRGAEHLKSHTNRGTEGSNSRILHPKAPNYVRLWPKASNIGPKGYHFTYFLGSPRSELFLNSRLYVGFGGFKVLRWAHSRVTAVWDGSAFNYQNTSSCRFLAITKHGFVLRTYQQQWFWQSMISHKKGGVHGDLPAQSKRQGRKHTAQNSHLAT